MDGYKLSRDWFDWCFENPEKISPNHSAIYFFAIEHCNRLGWKEKFGFPTQMVMDAIGIKKFQTYIRYFNDIVDWGFFRLVQKSTNQYSSNIISLVSATPKNGKALDKAFIKHRAKQTESIGQSNSTIDKQVTSEQETIEPTEIVSAETKNPNEEYFEKIQTDTESVIDTMNIPDEHRDRARQELFKFWNYWTEKDMRGKERWRKEKTFEVQRRLTTWLMNTKQFTSNQKTNGKRFAD